MHDPRRDWPATRWGLTAPESYVLLHGPKAGGAEAFKLALMELVARGALRLVKEEPGAGGSRRRGKKAPESALAAGANGVALDSPVLAVVRDLHREQAAKQPGPTVPIKDLAQAASRKWGGLGNFTKREILPALAGRGLYAREDYRILWLFPATRFVPTQDGEAARAELARWLEVGRQESGGWRGPSAGQALAFAGLAGAAVLLLQPMPPELQQLRRRDSGADGDSSATYYASGSGSSPDDDRDAPEPEPGDPASQDFGDLSLDLDLGAFDAFDSVDSAFDAVDAGVDSGGGDSGGSDGGGGDGGGGGGGE